MKAACPGEYLQRKEILAVTTAIFLGAGAAAAEGAPLQAGLFQDYFQKLRKSGGSTTHPIAKELATFFQSMFGINVDADDLTQVEFPTFEEALGILDLAIARGEGLGAFDIARGEGLGAFDLVNLANSSGRALRMRAYLTILIAKVIRDCLDDPGKDSTQLHKHMVTKLKEANLADEVIFVTTNYDLLLDNAILNCSGWIFDMPGPISYSIPFTKSADWPDTLPHATQVYKIHGSLSWLYCSTCNTIRHTPYAKKIADLYDLALPNNLSTDCTCPDCESVFEPLIVPPTFFKNMGNVFLTQIWYAAEQALRQVDQIIFCGYSFPDADLHIKYLIKRAQRNKPAMKFKVLNHYDRKLAIESKAEESRFKRFLGRQVDYTSASFQDFSADPGAYIS